MAISQGSQCGTQVTQPGITMLDYEQKIDDDPAALIPNIPLYSLCIWRGPFGLCLAKVKFTLGFSIGYKIKLKVNALPTLGTNKSISYAAMTREIYLKLKTKLCDPFGYACVTLFTIKIGRSAVYSQGPFERYNPSNILPYESFAGGTNNLKDLNFRLLAINGTPITLFSYFNIIYPSSQFFDVSFQNPIYSYISRVSALDIQNPVADDYSKLLAIPISGLNRSAAASFNCHEGTDNGGVNQFNIASGRFTKRNSTWMFNTMQGIPNTDYCFTECGKPTIGGPNLLCIGETNFVGLSGTLFNNSVVTWGCSPAATLGSATGLSTSITGISNGIAFVYAHINNVCASSQPDVKAIEVGTNPRTFNIVLYPAPYGPEPTCFVAGTFLQLMATNVYPNEAVAGWEWGYRYGGVTYTSGFNSQFYTVIAEFPGVYEVFVKHRNECGVSVEETVRIFDVVSDCPTWGRMTNSGFAITANPNPAKGVISLQASYPKNGTSKTATTKQDVAITAGQSATNISIGLYRAAGSTLVREYKFKQLASNYKLPIDGLPSGIYYLTYKDGSYSKSITVVVE